MAEKKEKKPEEQKPKEQKLDVDQFISNKLKAINEIDGRLGQFLAGRVLANKRGKK